MRLGDLSNSRSNSFDLIRFTAAAMVIWAHSAAFCGGLHTADPVSKFLNISLGSIAVEIFFIISGFLITQSCFRSSNPVSYLTARFLRIFPGLLVCLLFTIFVIGPLATKLPLKEYFAHSYVGRFLFENLTLYDGWYFLPGVFAKNPYPGVVNHSLWTLWYEFLWYLIVLLLGTLRLLKTPFLTLLFAALFLLDHFGSVKIYGLALLHLIHLGVYFTAGMVIYSIRGSIVISYKNSAVLLALFLLAEKFLTHDAAMAIFGSCLIFSAAYLLPQTCHRFSKHGDFSYGIYIYAYPIQQYLVYLFQGKMEWYENFALSFIITLGAAVLSWHLIEKRALAAKKSVSEQIWDAVPGWAKRDIPFYRAKRRDPKCVESA